MVHILQHLVMPNLAFGAPEEMHVRTSGDGVRVLLSEKKLQFKEGGRASFDTFFNSMTVGTWRKHCSLDDLHLVLAGQGKFLLRFGMRRIGHGHRWLDEQIIELVEGKETQIEMPFWSNLDSGMLYFALEAQSDGELHGGYLATSTAPERDVKLGIVITHFNRKQYVLPAIKRLRDELLSDPLYKGKIELVVVDNSRNITPEEAEGITVIPNTNLGGSGGFMRGLLHLKDEGTFTHCLFMDDDASCEVDSIKRAYALLSYSITPRFAIAGSMLREVEPYCLFEKGAKFDGICRPLKSGLDMRKIQDLLFAELEDRKPDYGGWWLFAFNVNEVENYAFPFFVRGDDIQFSLLNKFNICTSNGIACWGDDFGLKSGPLPIYLDVRNHLIQKICVFNSGPISTAILATRFFAAAVFSYNYATAKAIKLALQHIQEGPEFWVENIDTSKIRELIGSFAGTEKLAPISRAEFNVEYRSPNEIRFRRFVRVLTLNGFLLPRFLLKNAVAFQNKGFRGSFREVFRYKRVLYEYEPLGLGYVAEHNKARFFSELFSFTRQLLNFAWRFNFLKREYQEALPEMTSEAFWRKVYADE